MKIANPRLLAMAALVAAGFLLAGCGSSGGSPKPPSQEDCNNTPVLGDFGIACTDNADCQLLSLQWEAKAAVKHVFAYTIKGGSSVIKKADVSPGGASSAYIQQANTTSASALPLGVGTREYTVSFHIDGCSNTNTAVLRAAK